MKKGSKRGFTIVELLVVIVVIGILAAITIVSYSGITAKANTTKALSNAQIAQSIAEIYNADMGYFPVTTGAFAAGSTNAYAKLPAGVTVVPGLAGTAGTPFASSPASTTTLWGTTITSANFANTVTWACSGGTASAGNCAGNTGGRITYYDFVGPSINGATTPGQSTNVIYVGAATSASTFFVPAS